MQWTIGALLSSSSVVTALCLSQNGCASYLRGLGIQCNSTMPPQHFIRTERGGVPTTPDRNTSAKVLRYEWEPYRDTNWWRTYYFQPREEGTLVQNYRDRNGRCIAILLKVSWSGVDMTLLTNFHENCSSEVWMDF